MARKIKVTLVKGLAGRKAPQRATVEALGLGRIGSQRVHEETPQIAGMLFHVKHLVQIEEVEEVKA